MSTYKNIRDISARLLQTFKTAGVKLTEGQKADIDGFIKSIEERINETKFNTVKATKKVVEEKMDKEYKEVFESIFKHQTEYTELLAKVNAKEAAINESKRLSDKISGYLNVYLEKVMPKQSILDYNKMKKMETLIESMKDLLVVNDDDIVQKKESLEKQFKADELVFRKRLGTMKKQLDEAMSRELKAKKELDSIEAKKLLNEKTDDLPVYEARKIRQRLKDASAKEIEENFKKIYEEVEREMEADSKEEEKSIAEEIGDILDDKKDSSKKTCKKDLKVRGKMTEDDEDDSDDDSSDSTDETTEPRGDVVTEGKINSDIMANWIRTYQHKPYQL